MRIASSPVAGARPRLRWRFILSNAGLGGLFVVFVVANGREFLDRPRLSIGLLIAFQAVVVAIALSRREARRVDQRLVAFVVGWAGTVLPLFLRPTPTGEDLLVGQAMQGVGLVLQIVAIVSLGRSFGVVAADRGIQTGGAYRVVRHPMYAAYLITDVGFVLSHPTVANLVAISAAAAAQVLRIRFEERHLMANPDYAEFSRIRRWRLVPGVW